MDYSFSIAPLLFAAVCGFGVWWVTLQLMRRWDDRHGFHVENGPPAGRSNG